MQTALAAANDEQTRTRVELEVARAEGATMATEVLSLKANVADMTARCAQLNESTRAQQGELANVLTLHGAQLEKVRACARHRYI